MINRTTPKIITELKPNEVFVFGSNMVGRYGKGAALQAVKWGAVYGQEFGPMGKTYGIPTKDYDLHTLDLWQIRRRVNDFILWAAYHTGNTFLVTEIGCGLAGYNPKDIASMFSIVSDFDNIHLPESFWQVIV